MLQSEEVEPDCCCFEGYCSEDCSGNYFAEDCFVEGCSAGIGSGCFDCQRVGFQCWAYLQRIIQCFGLFIGWQLREVCLKDWQGWE